MLYYNHNFVAISLCFANVSATIIGNTKLASEYIFIYVELICILPHVIASDIVAPVSLQSYSIPVLTKTPKLAPFLHIFAFMI